MTEIRTTKLTELIIRRQSELGVSDLDLSTALGYQHVQVIGMIKHGHMRLPMNKVKALAATLSVEPHTVLRLAMENAAPGLLAAIEDVLNPLKLSASEERLIRHCRKLARGSEVAPMVIDGKGVVALITI